MDNKQAFEILVRIASMTQLNMQDNTALRQAIQVLDGLINPKETPKAPKS